MPKATPRLAAPASSAISRDDREDGDQDADLGEQGTSRGAGSVPGGPAALRSAARARSAGLPAPPAHAAASLERADQIGDRLAGSRSSSSRWASRRPPSAAQRALAVLGRELAQGRQAAGAQPARRHVDALAVGVERARELVDAAGRRHRRHGHHRHLAASRARRAPGRGRRRARLATSPRSALVTTSTSGTSMIPALRNCSTSPEAGCTTTATVSQTSSTSVSDWPDADRLDHHHVEGGAPARRRPRGWRAARPPSRPPAAVERIRMPSSLGSWSIRARSPSSEPPERFDDGSTASTATVRPSRAPLRDERGQQRRLAGARRAGHAHQVRRRLAAERRGGDLRQQRRGRLAAGRRAVLDQVERGGRGGAVALAQAASELGGVGGGHRRGTLAGEQGGGGRRSRGADRAAPAGG